MNYISTKELSARWGISTNRILFLVKEGRIPNAKKIGHSWVFPENSEKPCDLRTHTAEEKPETVSFRFPIYCYSSYSEKELEEEFSPEERIYYRAERRYYRGQYDEVYNELSNLLNLQIDTTLRVGVLYYLSLCCIHKRKYYEMVVYYERMKVLLEQEIPYKRELQLLVYELETYFKGNQAYKILSFDDHYHYHESTTNFLFLISAFSLVMNMLDSGSRVSILPYEIICSEFDETGNIIAAQMLHNYLAAMYRTTGNSEAMNYHLRKALRNAIDNGYPVPGAFFYRYFSPAFDALLEEPEFSEGKKIREMSELFYADLEGLMQFLGVQSRILQFSEKEIEYIQLAIRGLTNKEVAALKGISVSAVSKYYSRLYELTGTKGKEELARFCSEAVVDYSGSK